MTHRWHLSARVSLLVACALATSCGITVTSDSPPYEELDPKEKQTVDVILAELTALNAAIKGRTSFTIDPLLDRDHIDVAFEETLFAGNLGDGRLHVATWENLSDDQRVLIQTWFAAPTLEAARTTYEKFFYQFLAVSNGVKQFIYNALTVAWTYQNRSLFNLESDSIRNALAHYDAASRRAEMWTFVTTACAPVLSQYGATYSAHFDKVYLRDHYTDLANPKAPTGYMYFICRWITKGKDDAESLSKELAWLLSLKT